MITLPSPLLTDLYQLTMMQAYWRRDMHDTAVFEFFVRSLPPQRNFLVAAGLEQVLEFLEHLHFAQQELEWLADRFAPGFVDYLAQLRFTGDVHALPEGTLFFPNEPILRITAPLPQAQLVESRLINLLHFQTLIASKAARCVLAARDRQLVDFGLRRAHGAEAGLLAARASYLAGFHGTATVLAGAMYGIPLYGTMAHSFVQAHADETEAFLDFARSLPENVVLLIDTYDTEAAAAKVAALAPALQQQGIQLKGVRIDSGDLTEHSLRVRRILDLAGLEHVAIFASGNLDDYLIEHMLHAGAAIDGFGVGTRLDTSADAPYLDCAYKLEEYAGRPRRKRSEGKATWPGRKQVYRRHDADGRLRVDVLTVEDDVQAGVPLLQAVMRAGQRLARPKPLHQLRAHALGELARLPPALRTLKHALPYPVVVSAALEDLVRVTDVPPDVPPSRQQRDAHAHA